MTRRILLIEDEQLSQDIITALLRGQGYLVDVVIDGFAALELSRKQRYDIALVDYHLPEMDGYTLGRLLRDQHPEDLAPVLIGLTADRNGLAARRGSDAVFRAILPKPIKPADLFSTIERLSTSPVPTAAPLLDKVLPTFDDARRAAARLWRNHGLETPPKAFASPPPSKEQAAALNLCFELVSAEQAECVVLLERHGINDAIRISKRDVSHPLPIVGLSADHADICDLVFRIEDSGSWRALADAFGGEASVVGSFPEASATAARIESLKPRSRAGAVAVGSTQQSEPEFGRAVSRIIADPVPVAPSEIRTLLLAGVHKPLQQLRHDLVAEQCVPQNDVRLENRLTQLDGILSSVNAIADALSPSRPSSAEAADFDPSELVGTAIEMIRDSRPQGTVRLSCRIDDDMPSRLRGDVHRLTHIVLTLLEDACIGDAPAALVLHLGFEGIGKSFLVRLCQDDGHALPEDSASVVGQLRRLRLSTLAGLVQLMGGNLTQKRGQTVLSLPAEPAIESEPQVNTDCGHEPAHVMLVDDGATSGKLLTLILTQKGHRVCRVGDCGGALFAYGQAKHDLVVFDLPSEAEARLAALASLRTFRAAEPQVPAIVLVAASFADDDDTRRSLRDVHVLAKPFSPAALDDAVVASRRPKVQIELEPVLLVDRKLRESLVNSLGEATVTRLTRQLLQQIEAASATLDPGSEGASRLIELAGCASMLGLADLAKHCAKPEATEIRNALWRIDATLNDFVRSAA